VRKRFNGIDAPGQDLHTHGEVSMGLTYSMFMAGLWLLLSFGPAYLVIYLPAALLIWLGWLLLPPRR
jgi:hypothetical protein